MSENEHAESYNDWVKVVENNDPGVTAQLIVDELETCQDENTVLENRRDRFGIPPGVGIRVLVDGEFYTVDEFIEGDPVLRPRGESGWPGAPSVELHFVPDDDDIAELYTTAGDSQ